MLNRTYYQGSIDRVLERVGSPVIYQKYKPSEKNRYGESKVKEYDPIPITAFVKYDPSAEELEEYGFDKENVDIVVKVPLHVAMKAGIELNVDDAIDIKDFRYFITSLQQKGIVGGDPLLVRVGCQRRSQNRGK